jgi:hypothetical protein
MKSLTKNMVLAIAVLGMAAGTVSAQTMKAEIPFAFRVGKQVMQPGEYLVRLLPNVSSTSVFTLANVDAHKTVILVPSNRSVPPKASAWASKLRFECGDGPCTLARVSTGDGNAYDFHSKRARDGEMRVAEITMRPERAE